MGPTFFASPISVNVHVVCNLKTGCEGGISEMPKSDLPTAVIYHRHKSGCFGYVSESRVRDIFFGQVNEF